MNQNDTHIIPKSAYLILPVVALAFYIAFIPHQSYPYPLHVDEWLHWANSEAILKAGSTTFNDPFSGGSATSLTSNLEAGFHLFWGVFHQTSGISWLTIFRYFPSVILAMTVLSVYVMAQRQGFGWEAALFVSLIPTTVGILGPSFLVPVAMGLLFVSLSLFIAFNLSGIWSYIVLFVFTCFLLIIHAPSAICLVIILIPYILLNLRSNFKHSLGLVIALAVPFLAPFPWIFDLLLPTAQKLFVPQPLPEYVDFPRLIKAYGYLPVGLCLLGTLVLAMKGGRKNYGLVIGLLALLAMLVTFYTFHYGISIMYERGLIFMMLMVGIVAGSGLMAVKNLRLSEWLASKVGAPAITRYLGWFLCLVLVGITLSISIPDRQDIPYYHMINEEDYQAFIWIKDNVGEEYDRAILDPWKATSFTAITGKKVYTRIHAFPKPSDNAATSFLEEGCRDTAFLKEGGISVIYTEQECHNPDLTEVRENVYLLKKS
jgi:hypothetical protein